MRRGQQHTTEAKAKISKALTGRKLSAETRERMREMANLRHTESLLFRAERKLDRDTDRILSRHGGL